MLNKATIHFLASLSQKKHRDEHGLFLAEGKKLIADLRRYRTPFFALYTTEPSGEGELISETDMQRISAFKTPPTALGVFHIPRGEPPVLPKPGELQLALDDVQDPGNLGTILRLCSWFGLTRLLCSPHSADCYNPKAVQASMGAIAHVRVAYTPLPPFMERVRERGIPVYGTFMQGKSLYQHPLSAGGVVVLGSEGQGISPEVARHVTQRLHIPSFSPTPGAESLNVATAAAVVCSEFRRGVRG